MSMFIRKTAQPALSTQLAEKGQSLRATQAQESASSQAFIAAAKDAAIVSETAGKHAAAVEQALRVLDDAGVAL